MAMVFITAQSEDIESFKTPSLQELGTVLYECFQWNKKASGTFDSNMA
jgi:hypothetical protein